MREQLAEMLASYRGERDALIPVLQKVQDELGFLSQEAVAEIARFLGLPFSEVFGVITFYAQFRTTPSGKNVVRVCRGTACHVRGGARILGSVQHELGIKEGETTPDLEYTLETVACIGACALAPTMMINKDTHGRLKTKKVTEIFAPWQGREKDA
jgi:NADH-quinone oxidoreductase subunit E